MGNRAVIVTKKGWQNQAHNVGIYLHWNGGRDSIEAFLTYCKIRGYRPPEQDCYGWSALACVISNFFGCSGMSIGIDTIDRLDLDNYDNGVYIIEDWNIVARDYVRNPEQNVYDLKAMLLEIDKSMSKALGEETLINRFNELDQNFKIA